MKNKKIKIVFLLLISPFILIFLSNYSIEKSAKNKTFFDVSKIKKNKVGLVLGTSKTLKNGIPENKIFLDYAGFRTLDSVVRSKVIFGQESITIISQQFHNKRAIYLAYKNGITAIGFNAKDVSVRYGLKVKIREYLARTKVFIDILFRVKPKF